LDKDEKNWLTYSSMAFEMFAIIGILTASGFFLDKRIQTTPAFTILLLIIGLIAAFYRIFKQFK
jgi:F0F1-type ATP synthase assembly protein I